MQNHRKSIEIEKNSPETETYNSGKKSKVASGYKVHLSPEKNQYIFFRENYPRLMIYTTIIDGRYELNNLNFLDHCDASVLGKIMLEFHHYLKGEIDHPLYLDQIINEQSKNDQF